MSGRGLEFSVSENLLCDGKFLARFLHLARHAVFDTDLDLVFAGFQPRRRQQARQRQPLAGITQPRPILSLAQKLLAAFGQNVFHVDRRPQRSLIDAGIINLHIDADVLASLVKAGKIRNHLFVADHKL